MSTPRAAGCGRVPGQRADPATCGQPSGNSGCDNGGLERLLAEVSRPEDRLDREADIRTQVVASIQAQRDRDIADAAREREALVQERHDDRECELRIAWQGGKIFIVGVLLNLLANLVP